MTGNRTRVVKSVVQRLRHYTTVQLLPDNLIFYIYIYSDNHNSKWKLTVSSQCLTLITVVGA